MAGHHIPAEDQYYRQKQPQVYWHEPVMCREVTEVLGAVPDGIVLDATVGGGGHAAALLEGHPGLRLVGIDRDLDALKAAAVRLKPHRSRVILRHARFDDLGSVLSMLGHQRISAALFDLGVSSAHFDQSDRGFSYRLDGPLDMRMDRTTGVTAADIVNYADERTLVALLRRNGDEPHARRIASAIVVSRPFDTTSSLAAAVSSAVPAATRRRHGHPARRTFQALRIEVNSELVILDAALESAIERLIPGGRCAVLAYHSGEDRIVKRVLRRAAGETLPPRPGLPPPPDARRACVRLLWRGVHTPTEAETVSNHRSTSARFRAVERINRDY